MAPLPLSLSSEFLLLSLHRVPAGGAGPPRNNVVGGSPLAKGITTTMHPGSGSLSSLATATRPALPITTPQAHAQHPTASPPTGSCLRHSAQPVASQARSTISTGTFPDSQGPHPARHQQGGFLGHACETHLGPRLQQCMCGWWYVLVMLVNV